MIHHITADGDCAGCLPHITLFCVRCGHRVHAEKIASNYFRRGSPPEVLRWCESCDADQLNRDTVQPHDG